MKRDRSFEEKLSLWTMNIINRERFIDCSALCVYCVVLFFLLSDVIPLRRPKQIYFVFFCCSFFFFSLFDSHANLPQIFASTKHTYYYYTHKRCAVCAERKSRVHTSTICMLDHLKLCKNPSGIFSAWSSVAVICSIFCVFCVLLRCWLQSEAIWWMKRVYCLVYSWWIQWE